MNLQNFAVIGHHTFLRLCARHSRQFGRDKPHEHGLQTAQFLRVTPCSQELHTLASTRCDAHLFLMFVDSINGRRWWKLYIYSFVEGLKILHMCLQQIETYFSFLELASFQLMIFKLRCCIHMQRRTCECSDRN